MYYENAGRRGDALTIACIGAIGTFMVVLK